MMPPASLSPDKAMALSGRLLQVAEADDIEQTTTRFQNLGIKMRSKIEANEYKDYIPAISSGVAGV